MNITIKPTESLLPFLVVEAISAQNVTFVSMSVRMMDMGWAWLVSGRKLLVWKFKEFKSSSLPKARRTLSPCFELQLPQSDLIHKADLINVFFLPQNPNASIRTITIPAAVAISPEGTIRFWTNVANDRFVETTATEAQGQDFCSLTSLSNLEYLVGTTTGSVFLLKIDTTSHDPKNVVVCSPLAVPSGLLSGIGKRMSNLFFGSTNPDMSADTRRPLIAVPTISDRICSNETQFFILSSALKLRHWARASDGSTYQNQLIREWDLQKSIQRKLLSSLHLSQTQGINFWPVDMITTKANELMILLVTLDPSRNNMIKYATCLFNPFQSGDTIGHLRVLRSHSWYYTNESEEQILSIRFLERQSESSLCFLFDRKFLFLAQTDKDILDAVDYANQDDGILGASHVEGQATLFTQRNGLVYAIPVISERFTVEGGDETSIQVDPSRFSINMTVNQSRIEPPSAVKSSSNNVEPMLIELDHEDDEQENEGSKIRPQQIRRNCFDISSSTQANKSTMESQNSIKLDEQSTTLNKTDEVGDFLKESKEFEWLQLIDQRHYKQASEVLLKLSENSETLKDRRETLRALAKLAQLAE